MPTPRALAFSVLAVALMQSGPLIGEETTRPPVFSKHISDAILAGFRKVDSDPAVASPALADKTDPPGEVDPELVTMPVLKVVTNRGAGKWDQKDLTVKTEAIPLSLGTGITEFKGKRFTVLIRKIFFIPIAFKIEW